MVTQTNSAYPLSWPLGWPRTPANERKRAAFHTQQRTEYGHRAREVSISEGTLRVLAELRALKAHDVIISSDLKLRKDGLPLGDQREPNDPGAAVYWTTPEGEPRSMGIDWYRRVADNLAAIAATLSYLRGVERHGGAQILKRAFTGFTALPAPENAPVGWWGVMGIERTASVEEIKAAYRTLAKTYHPDNTETGDTEKFVVVGKAYEMARAERKF